MMDVNGLQALLQPTGNQGVEQDDGIATAGEADAKADPTARCGWRERRRPAPAGHLAGCSLKRP